MSPRPDRRPDSRPDRAPRRPAGASGGRAGARPAGASFRPGGTSRPRWGRPEAGRPDAPGDRPRYGRESGDRERPTGEWTPRERGGGESSGPPARFDRSAARPSPPRRGEEGRFEGRPTDRRPADRCPGEARFSDRRPSDRSATDRSATDRTGIDRSGQDRGALDRRPSDRNPTDRRPMVRRPTDRRPLDRRPIEGGPADRRPRPMAGRVGGARVIGARVGGARIAGSRDGGGRPPVLFRSAGRGDGRSDFGAPSRRPDRDSFRADTGPSPEAENFAAAAPSDLIWGRHSAQATLESGRPIHRIWCTPEMRFSPKFLQLLRDAKSSGVLVEEVTWARLGQISGGAVHQGIVLQPAAAETLDLATLIDGCRELGESPLLLAVDGLTDPQNLGAIVRSGEALGAHGMVLPQRRNAGLTGTVAKVAAGALEHLPVARVVNLNRSLETLKDEGYRVIGLAEEGNVSLEEADLGGALVIVTGSEGDGLSMLTRRNCDQLVRIPLRGATPSLNASVATALLLYEIARRGWMRGLHGNSPAPRLVRPALPAPAAQESVEQQSSPELTEAAMAELTSAEVMMSQTTQPEQSATEDLRSEPTLSLEFTAAELVAESLLEDALLAEGKNTDTGSTAEADGLDQSAIPDHSMIGDYAAQAAAEAVTEPVCASGAAAFAAADTPSDPPPSSPAVESQDEDEEEDTSFQADIVL
ncbi:MAG: 23S rRNA (guanosine(2251)-2'-O)-methyltransferase RlmB [Cyanobacteria bacterium]|nr:23S rRNA (guanosine(2251)-2'-O)-methyltransferase RlmB [Cyanobacteriota bacterium]